MINISRLPQTLPDGSEIGTGGSGGAGGTKIFIAEGAVPETIRC